jgi:hypothetical protein
MILVLFVFFISCAPDGSLLSEQLRMLPVSEPIGSDNISTVYEGRYLKTSQGLIVNGPKDVFGGFMGDCASDENFSNYWECQAENAGDSFN